MSNQQERQTDYAAQVIHGTYYPHIDGIRAFAILPVFLYHLAACLCPGGFAGVDVFFVLSGYLITGGILKDLKSNRFTISDFYLKRIRRVFPAYFLMIALVFAAGFCVYYSSPMRWLGEASAMSAVFLANVFFSLGNRNYFGAASQNSPLENLWSLSVEEQFYIFIPLLLALLWKWKKLSIRTVLWGISLCSLAGATYLLYDGQKSPVFYHLPWRAWELLAGSLLSLAPRPQHKSAAHAFYAVFGLVLVCLPYGLLDATQPIFPGIGALPSVVGTVLLIRYGQSFFVGRILSWRPFVFVGKISYSLYLFHWPVIVLWIYCKYADVLPAERLRLWDYMGIAAVSFLLAYGSWRWVEIPCRLYQWTKKKAFGFASSGIFIISALGLGASLTSGFKNCVHKEANLYVDKKRAFGTTLVPWAYKMIHQVLPQKPGAAVGGVSSLHHLGDISAKPGFIVMGDSHAGMLRSALQETLSKRKMSCYLYSVPGSLIFDHDENGDDQELRRVLDIIKNDHELKKVVLVHAWSSHRINEDHFIDFCKMLHGMHKSVYVCASFPYWDYDVAKVFVRSKVVPLPAKYQNAKPWLIPRQKFDSLVHKENIEIFEKPESMRLITVLPSYKAFLNQGYYMGFDEEKRVGYTSDGSHLTADGSLKAVEYILSLILDHQEEKDL